MKEKIFISTLKRDIAGCVVAENMSREGKVQRKVALARMKEVGKRKKIT